MFLLYDCERGSILCVSLVAAPSVPMDAVLCVAGLRRLAQFNVFLRLQFFLFLWMRLSVFLVYECWRSSMYFSDCSSFVSLGAALFGSRGVVFYVSDV